LSVAPIDYFNASSQLSQDIVITDVNQTFYQVNYTYNTGVCMEAINAENFGTSLGEATLKNITNVLGDEEEVIMSCFPTLNTVLAVGESINVKFILFERYPEPAVAGQVNWFKSRYPIGSVNAQGNPLNGYVVVDYDILDATIIIQDYVSGDGKEVQLTYNNSEISQGFAGSLKMPVGTSYTIKPSMPNPVAPFDLSFIAVVQQLGPAGMSSVGQLWFIPVTGSLPSVVPNLYPVASVPNLIYLVIRDPPGK
jgi:hypothetical protein